ALGLVGVVEEAQAGGSAQVGEVEAGAVVDVHDRVAPAGGAGGRQGERGQEVVDGGLRVRQEAVGALGGRPVATGLRQGAPQVAFQVGQNQRQTDAQTRLSEARGLDVGRHGKTGEDHAKLRSRRTPFLLAYPSANASTSPCVRVRPGGPGNNDNFVDRYNVVVSGGQTRRLLLFGQFSSTVAEATTRIAAFDSNQGIRDAGFLAGLTAPPLFGGLDVHFAPPPAPKFA